MIILDTCYKVKVFSFLCYILYNINQPGGRYNDIDLKTDIYVMKVFFSLINLINFINFINFIKKAFMKAFTPAVEPVIIAFALFTASVPSALYALEISDGLALDGSKVISYKMSSNAVENNRVDQNLKINLKGNINEKLVTDLKIDDSLTDKVEKMYFEYSDKKVNMVLGDINFSPVTRFGVNEKKMRGFMANFNELSSNKDNNLTLLYAFESGRPEKDVFMGEGRMGPFKLSAEKLIPQSDRVYIDAVLKNRNMDYGIDYDNGILTFNEEVPLGAEISVLYSSQTGFDNLNRHSFGAFSENGISKLGVTKIGFVRTEEELQNSFIADKARTEFNLNQDFKLNEKLITNLEYSRSFKDSAGVDGADEKDGAAIAMSAKFAARHFDTNLKISNVEPAYIPYHNGHIRTGKKSELYFDLHPGGADGALNKLNGTFGFSKAAAANDFMQETTNSSGEDKVFGKFLYNFNDNVSVNTNIQNSSSGEINDVKLNARSSKVNIENGLSRQIANGGADELKSLSFKAASFPVNKNVYFVEYNDSSLTSYSKVKDENNDFNFKFKRKINGDLSLGYSLTDMNRKNMAEAESKAVENRMMLDYNYSGELSLSAQAALRGEERSCAYEPRAELKSALFGAKYTPLDFVKLLIKREVWDSSMINRGINFTKIEDSAKVIIAWPHRPYSLEVKNYIKTPEYDFDSGALRGRQVNNAARLDIKAGSKFKLSSQVSQSIEENTLSPKINTVRQEVKYKMNDDMDFFFNVEREKSFISNISSIFRLEAKL